MWEGDTYKGLVSPPSFGQLQNSLSSELPMNSAEAFIESSSASAQQSYVFFFSTGVDHKAPPTASCILIPSESVSSETQPGFVQIKGLIVAAFTS